MWDPCRGDSGFFEIAAYPVTSGAAKQTTFEEKSKNPRGQRGQWETLHRVGLVLQHAKAVKFLLADRHGSHSMLAKWIFGRPVDLSRELREMVPWLVHICLIQILFVYFLFVCDICLFNSKVPFFKELTFRDLPMVRFPIRHRICLAAGQSFHFFPGPAHCQKNFTEQLRTPLGTAHYGTLWVDLSGALELGLFPVAFLGTDTMSDRQSALVSLGF